VLLYQNFYITVLIFLKKKTVNMVLLCMDTKWLLAAMSNMAARVVAETLNMVAKVAAIID
jgi:hypothetical protein